LLGSSSVYNAYNLKKQKIMETHAQNYSQATSQNHSSHGLLKAHEFENFLDGLTNRFKLSMALLFPMQTYSSIALVAML
jgi:chromosomal replication initiation ATPase DnaA